MGKPARPGERGLDGPVGGSVGPERAEPDAEADLPLLERVGLRYVERLTRKLGRVAADDAIHILDPAEWRALVRIERQAILRSATAGALSALACVVAVIAADAWVPLPLVDPAWPDYATYYGLIFGVAAVAAVLEVVYIFRDALRSTLLMARAAGLPLISAISEHADPRVAGALVRAALELPNSAEARGGVDPLREAPRWRLVAYSLLYKGKIAVTNFALKMIVRRALGRAGLRGLAELVAIPVTALWNAVVTWQVMREARLRIVGPSAAQVLVDELWEGHLSSPQRGGALRAVASAIVRSNDLHPNLVALMDEVRARAEDLEDPGGLDDTALDDTELDDTEHFLRDFAEATEAERSWILAVSTLAAILDGKVAPGEEELLRRLRVLAGLSPNVDDVKALARRLRRGQPITAAQLRACGH